MTSRPFSRLPSCLLPITGGVVFTLVGSMASAQEDAFAIRTVLISVTDAEGARIEGLKQEDFELSERGIPRDVVDAVDEEVGAELYILVDTSIAFQPHIFVLRKSLQAFVDALGSRFRITLYEFGTRPHRLAGPTEDRVEVSRQIGRMIAQAEGAYVLDVLHETAREMNESEQEEGTLPVRVVIVTGTGPELSNTSDVRALEAGRKSGAVFDVILYEGGRAGDFMKRAKVDDVLDRLSRESGGSLKRFLSVNALEGALLRLASEQLQPRYRVSFLTELFPPTDPSELQVSVRRAGAEAAVVGLLPGERRVERDP